MTQTNKPTTKEMIDSLTKVTEYMDKYPCLTSYGYGDTMKRDLQRLKVQEMFDVPLYESHSDYYGVVNGYDSWTIVMNFKLGDISISDNGKQPQDEWLYRLSFTCGAYIFGDVRFGDDYPVKTFDSFFNELKEYNPAYSDSINHSLYFRPAEAKAVHENFWRIFKEYKDKAKIETLDKRKKVLQDEMDKLNAL